MHLMEVTFAPAAASDTFQVLLSGIDFLRTVVGESSMALKQYSGTQMDDALTRLGSCVSVQNNLIQNYRASLASPVWSGK